MEVEIESCSKLVLFRIVCLIHLKYDEILTKSFGSVRLILIPEVIIVIRERLPVNLMSIN